MFLSHAIPPQAHMRGLTVKENYGRDDGDADLSVVSEQNQPPQCIPNFNLRRDLPQPIQQPEAGYTVNYGLSSGKFNRGVTFPNNGNDVGLFVSEQSHPQHAYEFDLDDLSTHQREANYTFESESSTMNTAMMHPNPWPSLDNIRSNENTSQYIPIVNQPPVQEQGHHNTDPKQWVNPTANVVARMVHGAEPAQSQHNDPDIPVGATIPGLEPTDAPHHQFCALLIERNINPYDFISFMLAHRHLDADRLREILSGLAGQRVPSGRRRAIRREARICSKCGTKETKQWRRDPDTKADLCNPCGQHAYRTRMD